MGFFFLGAEGPGSRYVGSALPPRRCMTPKGFVLRHTLPGEAFWKLQQPFWNTFHDKHHF